MVRAILIAAAAGAAAVAGGNLLVTTTEHPLVWRKVRVLMTGEIRGKGTLYVYRNLDGVKCGNSRDDQERLGRRARELMKPLAVETSFDAETSYVPARFGVQESVCAYLYTAEQSTGLPPDAGYSDSEVRVGFAIPPRWKASPSHGRALVMEAIHGSRTRVRASGSCGGNTWRIGSLPVRKDGSFGASNGITRVTGRFRGRVTGAGAVSARVSGLGCPLGAMRLTGTAPAP